MKNIQRPGDENKKKQTQILLAISISKKSAQE